MKYILLWLILAAFVVLLTTLFLLGRPGFNIHQKDTVFSLLIFSLFILPVLGTLSIATGIFKLLADLKLIYFLYIIMGIAALIPIYFWIICINIVISGGFGPM